MGWLHKEPEPKHEYHLDYEPLVETVLYDEEGYELVPDLFDGGYHRKVDEVPVEDNRPPLWES